MGNCAKRLKENIDSCLCNRRAPPTRPPQTMNCPKCQQHFGPYTTYDYINNHMDNCMNTQGSVDPQSPIDVEADGATFRVAKSIKAKLDEEFYWIKKQNKDGSFYWIKEKAQNRFSNAMLSKMPLTEAAKIRFEDKRKWFRLQVERFRIPWVSGADILRVDRNDLLKSSIKGIKKCNLFKEVKVEFKDDEKINDAGGLLREWTQLIIKELMNPELGIFIRSDCPEVTYTINPKSENNEATLDIYEFAGRVIGKAMFERITVNIHFDSCMLGYFAGRQLTLEDMQSLDTPVYNSLIYIRDNTIDGSDVFEEYFVVPSREQPVRELCPNGATQLVTDANKLEYIQLIVDWFGKKRIERKLNAFLNGIATAIPMDQMAVFDAKELEMMIAGVPFIDVDDWEANSIYKGSLFRTHQVARWFWLEMHTFDQKQLAKILQFSTGSSRTPVEGFRVLESNRGAYSKFCIDSTKYIAGQTIITAHTCFNRIVLPMYPSADILKRDLQIVLQSDFNGVFGIE